MKIKQLPIKNLFAIVRYVICLKSLITLNNKKHEINVTQIK